MTSPLTDEQLELMKRRHEYDEKWPLDDIEHTWVFAHEHRALLLAEVERLRAALNETSKENA